jgi:hypothetical protein
VRLWMYPMGTLACPGPPLSWSLLLTALRWLTLFFHNLPAMISASHDPEIMELADHGLKSLKPWAKINLFSFSVYVRNCVTIQISNMVTFVLVTNCFCKPIITIENIIVYLSINAIEKQIPRKQIITIAGMYPYEQLLVLETS